MERWADRGVVLRLDDQWVWDSWVADDGELYHLFFLQAPRALGDPAKRHVNAVVGHATSRDLVDWEYHGVCLRPADAGFDDLGIWTGSVLRAPHDGRERWWMFYTAISTAGHHIFDQRVGAAVSDDLHTWERVRDQPSLMVDGRWYTTLRHRVPPDLDPAGPDPATVSETWRDPLVVADPAGRGWHMLVTARAAGAARNDDGVVAHARSSDLLTWEVGAPLCRPGAGFGQLEVLQSKRVEGRDVLVFTCHPQEMTPARRAASGGCSTWSLPSPGPLGPWDVTRARPFTADPDLFAAPLVQCRDGGWAILGFRNLESRGLDGFAIHAPIPVTLDADGYLVARGPGR